MNKLTGAVQRLRTILSGLGIGESQDFARVQHRSARRSLPY